MQEGVMAAVFAFLYFVFLIGLGEYARRKAQGSRADYFLASRRFGTTVLFFSMLGTIASAFAILGYSGQVYRTGLANFGSIVGGVVLLIPLTLATFGARMWAAGKKFDHITPAQLINHRYNSERLGPLLSFFMTIWTVPYLVLGGIGGGLAFEAVTNGLISYTLGAGILLAVVTIYLVFGGMRGSGYTDVIQGALMLLLMGGFTAFIALKLGGFTSVLSTTAEANLDLISRGAEGQFTTKAWLSAFLMMGLSAIMFPQVVLRVFSSKSLDALKKMVLLFPIGILVIMLSSTLLGFMGRNGLPGLEAEAADNVVPELITAFAPEYAAAAALVVILAALMSSLDSQTLSVSTLISEDFLRDLTEIEDSKIPPISKVLTTAIMAIVFVLTVIQPGTIFFLVEFAFQGYALLFYPVVVGLYWRNSTETGVLAGLLTGFIGLWLFQLGLVPSSWSLGFMPLVPLMGLQIAVTHTVSHFTAKPPEKRVNSYFEAFENIW